MTIISQQPRQEYQEIAFEMDRDSCMEVIEKELCEALADSKGTVREMCSHILGAAGKRVRPLLVIYSGLVFSGFNKRLLKAAVAAELIHMASLVHDDIIDNSELRRSRASVNKIWGSHFAVLCGDYLFAKAFGILAQYRLIKSMDYMVKAIQNMCHGEILQAGDAFNCNIQLDTYYERIAKKTAVFLECCCKSGAAVNGANEFQKNTIGEFGLNIGLAFQMTDDILDFCGDVKIMGKPKREDLRQGNITLPVLLLLQHKTYGAWLRESIKAGELSGKTLDDITAALIETGMIEQSFNLASAHIKKAQRSLELLPQSGAMKRLKELVDMLETRVR